jgi:EAL domain-containing protein (putative c-di-GMP-specific phosphodiesterase class I)
MYFQPIMNLQTMHVSHYEALIRIFEFDNQMVLPQKFILSAEQSGVIQELDQKIIAKVFEVKAALQAHGIPARLSINLSGLSFRNENLFKDIQQLCSKYEIQAREIIFEITETAAVLDSARTKDIMEEIRELGCCFSLDDFGVGFSSLYYLKQFPFDYVKIDGSFVRNIKEDMDDQVMVRALVEVAQSFGQYTVAEFVENEETLNLLKKIGVDFAQGHHVGKPVSPIEIWPDLADSKESKPPHRDAG